MNQLLKNILGWLAYFLMLFILIYGIPKAMSAVLNTSYPMAAITSGSMWPALKTGDLVLIKGVKSKEDIKIDDIVVYRNEKGFTIHRVIKMNDETITTKGDANNISDLPVRYEEIVGKTVSFDSKPFRIPYLGRISFLLNKKNL